jgi:hypothetical protein
LKYEILAFIWTKNVEKLEITSKKRHRTAYLPEKSSWSLAAERILENCTLYNVHVYYEWLICILNDCTGAVM